MVRAVQIGLIGILVFACRPAGAITLAEAVAQAAANYPSVRVAAEEKLAAAAGVRLSRTSYLPRADFFGQLNRATRNNVYGLLLNQPYFSPISGPVLESNSQTSVWGSLVGVLVSWEPFDFGRRRTSTGVAEAGERRAEMAVERVRFDVETAAADTFLSVLAADETVKAAEAGVQRSQTLETAVSALVAAGLRPGVDEARARAERAAAETNRIRAQEAAGVARAGLAQLVGVQGGGTPVSAGRLLDAPPEGEGAAAAGAEAHPAARESEGEVDEARARQKALDASFFPKFSLEATTYARGTGARTDFTSRGGAAGLGPNIQNWGIGMSVTFSAFDFAALREEKKLAVHKERAAMALHERIVQDLGAQAEQARTRLDAARRVARQVPVQLAAARAAEQQANARYEAGLGTLVEVAEAQRLLTQAEIDSGLANLAIWRALLAVREAEGDLGPFLTAAGR